MSLTRLIATRMPDVHRVCDAGGRGGGIGGKMKTEEGRTPGLACERTILNEIYSGGPNAAKTILSARAAALLRK